MSLHASDLLPATTGDENANHVVETIGRPVLWTLSTGGTLPIQRVHRHLPFEVQGETTFIAAGTVHALHGRCTDTDPRPLDVFICGLYAAPLACSSAETRNRPATIQFMISPGRLEKTRDKK